MGCCHRRNNEDRCNCRNCRNCFECCHCRKEKEHEHCGSNWKPDEEQTHTHEYEGSVKIAEPQEDPHNHRFACVTGEAIFTSDGSHFHKLSNRTDFYEDHFHKICDVTGPPIPVGNGRHVHFVEGDTTVVDGHQHEFQFATLIDDPIGD
jgi:hypothetical protein